MSLIALNFVPTILTEFIIRPGKFVSLKKWWVGKVEEKNIGGPKQ